MMKQVRLPHRAVLQLRGRDPTKLLHALTTADTEPLAACEVPALYGALLTQKGRVLYDVVMSRSPQWALDNSGPQIVNLEVDADQLPAVQAHLREFKLRNKVTFHDMRGILDVTASTEEDLPVMDVPAAEADQAPPSDDELLVAPIIEDPRLPTGLLRAYVDSAAAASLDDGSALYKEYIYSRGIGEGSSLYVTDKSLPFEGNLDFLDGVSFRKGCYLGQELTHRTHVMLVTRKRLLPLRLISGEWPAAPAPLTTAKGQPAGTLLGSSGGHGVGVVRLRHLVTGDDGTLHGELRVGKGDGAPVVEASVPSWWPQAEVDKLTAPEDS